ncbi:MAG: DUF5305 family protein [Candidatus Hadarchaeales archaeon]
MLLGYSHSRPETENRTQVLLSYRHRGEYDYVAHLKPNELYDNRLELSAGEGTVYLPLLENLSLTFRYTFFSTEKGTLSSSYRVEVVLSTQAWSKSYPWLENSVQAPGNTLEFSTALVLDPSWVEERMEAISWETGTSTRSYDVQVRTSVHTVAQTGKGTVDESFSPQLTLHFVRDPAKGEYLTVEGLEERKEGAIIHPETLHRGEIGTLRRISYVLLAFALLCVFLTGWAYFSAEKPRKVEELVEPLRELVVELSEEPKVPAGGTTVRVGRMEDLGKIAEGLMKPVLHVRLPSHDGEEHLFLVLDGSVRYEHRVKALGGIVVKR